MKVLPAKLPSGQVAPGFAVLSYYMIRLFLNLWKICKVFDQYLHVAY
jgi:hypothetical protein